MLKQLTIQNVILINSSTLSFDDGFHIFSGETGAGKTAILQALSLILGARLDPQIIRKGKLEALVEAHFELSPTSHVYALLKEANLEIDSGEDLLIRREIKLNGKSKISINRQWTPLHLLKKVASHLVELVSQHSTHSLFDIEIHRRLLDQFGEHLKLAHEVKALYQNLQTLKKKNESLQTELKEIELLQKRWAEDLKEIEEAQLQSENEEEHIFQEYQKISTAKEQIEILLELTHTLEASDTSILSTLNSQINQLSKFSNQDPKLSEIQDSFSGATEELREVSFSLLHYLDTLEENPERLAFLDERLKLINHLKKRYGPTLKEVLETQEKLKEKISSQFDLSAQIEELQKEIFESQKKYEDQAEELTQKRIRAKDLLAQRATSLFSELNLPQAELIIELKEAYPDSNGNESVEFYLKANVGEKKTSLREKVSGGELSRVLLTLKLLLSELNGTPTLVFDEIDANLGGETAPKIGQLLQKVSSSKQVLAITHLPQVAIYGKHHYLIRKEQTKERTQSLVEKLTEKQKILEIERMLGGKDLSRKAQDLAKDLLKSSDAS